jgi:hypothetical protein
MTRGWLRKESVIETLCGMADELGSGGFRVSGEIPVVKLRRRGFWIPSRDAAGHSLPGFRIALALVIAHLPHCQS